jgi:hypothetical protein
MADKISTYIVLFDFQRRLQRGNVEISNWAMENYDKRNLYGKWFHKKITL